jgi:mannose-6-phosphate isomerase
MKKPKTYVEHRPWGTFEQFTLNERTTVKIITVKPRQELSLQYHFKRREFWRVLAGHPTVTVGKKKRRANVGDEFYVPTRTAHRLGNSSKKTLAAVLEISFGTFRESDIVRLEDQYGRIKR